MKAPASRPKWKCDTDAQGRPGREPEDFHVGTGPLISTSRFLMPCSIAARPATSEATWQQAGGLREPWKTLATRTAQENIALAVGDRDDGVVERN